MNDRTIVIAVDIVGDAAAAYLTTVLEKLTIVTKAVIVAEFAQREQRRAYEIMVRVPAEESCNHPAMVENDDPNDPTHVWKCAACGYVYKGNAQ